MVSAFLPPLDAEGQSMRERAGERRRIRLLIVAAYASVRAGLHSLLADAADITIIGEVLSGDDLERLPPETRPDVVLFDVNEADAARLPTFPANGDTGLVVLGDTPEDFREIAVAS